jgi:hypothetical protein
MAWRELAAIGRGALLALAAVAPAAAQERVPLRFAPGASAATVTGTVTGHDYVDYVLGARAGQTMTVRLAPTGTNGDGTVYANVLPPGSDDVAIFNGSKSPDGNGSVRLPTDGDYTVRVYLMGNDRDAGKRVDYDLELCIR